MKAQIKKLALLAVVLLVPSVASAQTYPTVPNNSVIGRIGVGTGTGPAQAIPFTSLPWTVNNTPINGGTNGQILYDNNGKVGEYSAAAARTYLGLASVYSVACSSNQWIAAIVAGVPGCTQPSFSNLSGNIAVSQMNSGTNASLNTVFSGAGNWAEPQDYRFTATNASPAAQTLKGKLQQLPVMCEDYSGGCTAANITQAMYDAAAGNRCFQFNGNYTINASVALVAPSGVLCLTGRGGLTGSAGMNGPLLDIKNSNNGFFMGQGLAFNCASVLSIPSAIKVWTDNAGGTTGTSINGPIIVNCRRGIQFGDPNYTDNLVDSNYMQGGGYTYNTAQPLAMYSSQSGLFVDNWISHADNTNLSSTFTGTCTGTTLAASAITGALFKDDLVTGTGVAAGTYIVSQSTGTPGQAGNYTVSAACTSSANSLTARPAAINYLIVGGSLNIRNGNVQNSIVGGKMFVARPVNSASFGYPYGRPSVTGATIEGSDIIFSSDTDGVATPGSGAFYMSGNQGDFSANTNCYITTDSAWTGTISVANNRLFSTISRTANNICANNSNAVVNFDLESFGSNMLQGYAGVSGGVQRMKTKDIAPVVTLTGTSATQGAGDSIVTFNGSGTYTYTMLSAARYPGRMLFLNNVTANAVNSASSNIQTPSGTIVSAIMAGGIGKWVMLVADGANWRIVANN
ncbi:hypothetical protein [Bradyrhizobium sp. 23AC]